jgi:hypothetical protein
VAKGYDEQVADRVLAPRKDEVTILLTPDRTVLRSTSTLRKVLPPLKGAVTQSATPKIQSNLSDNGFTFPSQRAPAPAETDLEVVEPAAKPQAKPAVETNTSAPAPAATGAAKANIVCPNCGKVYEVGPKKMRFCINCGRPFK